MEQKNIVRYGLYAAAIIAVAVLIFFTLHYYQSSPTRSEESLIGEIPELQATVSDTVLAEIDGTTVKVSLPDGHKEPIVLPKELPEDLRLQAYQGLDPVLQKSESSFLWFKQHSGNKIFGRTITDDGRDSSPVYVCDTLERVCAKTAIPGIETAVVPQGAVSPTGGYIALVLQHDVPNITTGTHWELLLYETEHLSLVKTINISSAIDRTSDAGYDSVASVAWNPDEKQLALSTNTKIIIADLSSDMVSIAYRFETSSDEESAYPVWDNTAFAWSSGGHYLVFAGFSDESSDTNDEESPDLLQVIDLGDSNILRTVVQGRSIGMP